MAARFDRTGVQSWRLADALLAGTSSSVRLSGAWSERWTCQRGTPCSNGFDRHQRFECDGGQLPNVQKVAPRRYRRQRTLRPKIIEVGTSAPRSPLIHFCQADRSRRPLQWADLAEDRLRLDRLTRNGAIATFFPWAAPIPREATKSLSRHPTLALRPASGCGAGRLWPVDRRRGRNGAGS